MAAPTPTTYTRQHGHHGYTFWHAVWTDTTNLTDTVVVDLSARADGYTNGLKIKKLTLETTTGISALIELDGTTDQFICQSPIGNSSILQLDFTGLPDGGVVKTAAGGAGDLLITTLSAASADEVYLFVEWEAY